MMKLHLGCGARIEPGWLNLDIDAPVNLHAFATVRPADLTRPLAFADASVDMIYSEHFIEHLALEDAERLLAECARVLKPGGAIRLSTPDLEHVAAMYQAARLWRGWSGESDRWNNIIAAEIGGDPLLRWRSVGWEPKTPAQMVNGALTLWGHRFTWDFGEVSRVLEGIGFVGLERAKYGVSRFEGMLTEARPDLGELIVEAVKPK